MEMLLKQISAKVEKGTLYVCMLLCIAMTLVATAHVVWRYVLNNALTWSEEFLRFALVWFSLLSASLIHKRREHIGIVVFRGYLPSKAQKFIKRLITFIEIIGTGAATIIGVILLTKVQGQMTPAMRLPFWLPYLAVPVSFAFMTLYGIEHSVNEALGKTTESATDEYQ